MADSGEIEFECPTEDACNLTTPARSQAKPRTREAVLTKVTPVLEETLRAPVAGSISEIAPLDRTSEALVTYHPIGSRNGDVITAINGKPVDGAPMEALSHLKELLKEPSVLDVTMLRDGQEVKLSIQR